MKINENSYFTHFPKKQGLYDPKFEHDNCGVGFVCDIKGRKSNDIVNKGLEVLVRMTHRGAVGADPLTGDGAGILIKMPHEFLQNEAKKANVTLPNFGDYGVFVVFLPKDESERTFCIKTIEKEILDANCKLLLTRDVPINSDAIGKTAQATEPQIKQFFIEKNQNTKSGLEFERQLYVIRKKIENKIKNSDLKEKSFFYIPSSSSQTLAYKGLLMPYQVQEFYLDLKSKDISSPIALVHSRYSTNTFPTWDLAQPFRYLAHNGEINTLRGNINWMSARHSLLKSELLKANMEDLLPIIVPGGSDSAALDNMVELLALTGRNLAHLMLMLVPAAYETNPFLSEDAKAFCDYHACMMEPWDGPAALAFTDGNQIGAVLDRNGLRPAKYIITNDDLVIMSSEFGVLDIEPKNIKTAGRLTPGKMFLVDTNEGRIIGDDELKKQISAQKPYKNWLEKNLLNLDDVKIEKNANCDEIKNLLEMQKVFGYTREDLKLILKPMLEEGKEPVGSMGDDMPSAILSKNSRLLYTYFKQLFAQVTNPPIDSIREEIVMSLTSFLGPEKNILEETEEHAKKIKLKNPILTNEELAKFKNINQIRRDLEANNSGTSVNDKISKNGASESFMPNSNFRTKTISLLYDVKNENAFEKRLDEICDEAYNALNEGFSFILLTDREVNQEKMALPALLAISTVHQFLIKKAVRKRVSLILESGEPREVFHFALLFGYGADAINPYLAYKSVENILENEKLEITKEKALKNYIHAVETGILKILSKMGISTLQSYKGAQIFEAVGIGEEVINKSFTNTPSRIGGIDYKIIQKETKMRHDKAFIGETLGDGFSREAANIAPARTILDTGGFYQWRKDGEFHLWNPNTIPTLQEAAKNNDYKKYKEFAGFVNNQAENPTTLRSLLKFKTQKSIDINEVESEDEIVKRFCTGAMSFGSISQGAHETMAIAMNRLKGKSNTGEGGEDPERFFTMPNGDSRRSAIKQVASGRFGVTSNYLANADEIQIKIAQGAKPGEGGQLPGHKVSVTIAKTRYTTPGVTLISPPPHHDIYSIEDLAQLIFDLKNANPKARVSVKLVSEIGVGTIAAGVAKGHADMILISGGDGGTGASPLSSIKYAGLPFELGISETHQTLVLNDLRSRVRLQTDGQIRTGRDIVIAAILGAEEYGISTACLIVMGCVMLRHCHLNNCSLGVATQDDILQGRFAGKVDSVVNYMRFVAKEVREIMAELGIRKIDELIGKTELLEVNKEILPWKAKNIDFSKILHSPKMSENVGRFCIKSQDHGIENVLDKSLIYKSQKAIQSREEVKFESKIANFDRTVGAMLSYEISKNYGEMGLIDDTIQVKFDGTAGQSFGAFLAKGITFELEGLANDYVGKGLSGGKIIIYPNKNTDYPAEKNVIIGNTTFYGAIHGEAYIRGIAGERFCIRNSGVNAVIEGIGDHGCEYMTGGRVVILGETGLNFGAGMSGGIAYVYDKNGDFKNKCNMEMVAIEELDDEDLATVKTLLRNHKKYTNSEVVEKFLSEGEIKKLVKIIPLEYKKILDQKKLEQKLGIDVQC